MGLENLKSAFSNIQDFSKIVDKTVEEISSNLQTDVTTMTTEFLSNTDYGNWPGPMDNWTNDKATGFTLNQKYMSPSRFVGVGGESPNMTFSGNTNFYSNTDYGNWPGPMNVFGDDKATGFTLNQQYMSPSKFTGIGGESPNMTWTNDIELGGSLFGTSIEPQEVDYMPNEKSVGFSANQVHQSPTKFTGAGEHSSVPYMEWTNNSLYGATDTVDFQKIDSSWTTPLTDLTFPDGFTKNMTESELAKGFYGDEATNFTNTNLYSAMGWEGTNVTFNGPNTTDWTSNTFDLSSNIPPDGTTWNTGDTFLTSYYDSIHTTNAISDTFKGPVDFMTGENSYYTEVNPVTDTNPASGIPGFTNEFNKGGYTFGESQQGNSKFLTWDIDGNYSGVMSTGTHTTIPIHPYGNQSSYLTGATSTFSDTVGGWFTDTTLPLGSDTTWNVGETSLTSYYDSIHTTNTISDTFGGPVDFMSGLSLHPDSVKQASTFVISGFDNNYNPGLFGGWSAEESYGDSKLLRMWAREENGKPIKTSLYTGYLGEVTNATIEFPGPIGAHGSTLTLNRGEVSFPGGYSAENTLGSSEFLEENDEGITLMIPTINHTIAGYGGSDGFDGNLIFDGESNLFISNKIKIQSGKENINPSKGSNKGGQESIQFKTLYTNDNTATDNKYLGPPQDGSNINALDKFDIKSELWNYTNSRDMSLAGGAVLALSSFGLGNIPGAFGGNGNEPYIIREIGKEDNPSSYFPLTTLMRDASRISKFLGSNKGATFVINQNIMGSFQQYRPYYDAGSTILNTALPTEGLGMLMMNYPRDYGVVGSLIDLVNTANTYTEWLDTRAIGFDSTNLGDVKLAAQNKTFAERELKRKPLAFQAGDFADKLATGLVDSLIPGGSTVKAKDVAGINMDSGIDSKKNMQNSMGTNSPLGGIGKGDIMTLMPIFTPEEGQKAIGGDVQANSSKLGMPFYFRDLRDGAVIFFRAYIEGLSETISPSWNSENYVGRSEPVYTYTNAEREIGFTLKLFAQTKDELGQIYTKMNRLTSLCYPEYKNEVVLNAGEVDIDDTIELSKSGKSRIMMKAPMVKFRLGELFGNYASLDNELPTSAEMVGFIKSLAYTFPDNSPWEIQEGYRVPKYIEVSITFQVIHSEVPSLDFVRYKNLEGKIQKPKNTFYGVNKTLFENMKTDGTIKRASGI